MLNRNSAGRKTLSELNKQNILIFLNEVESKVTIEEKDAYLKENVEKLIQHIYDADGDSLLVAIAESYATVKDDNIEEKNNLDVDNHNDNETQIDTKLNNSNKEQTNNDLTPTSTIDFSSHILALRPDDSNSDISVLHLFTDYIFGPGRHRYKLVVIAKHAADQLLTDMLYKKRITTHHNNDQITEPLPIALYQSGGINLLCSILSLLDDFEQRYNILISAFLIESEPKTLLNLILAKPDTALQELKLVLDLFKVQSEINTSENVTLSHEKNEDESNVANNTKLNDQAVTTPSSFVLLILSNPTIVTLIADALKQQQWKISQEFIERLPESERANYIEKLCDALNNSKQDENSKLTSSSAELNDVSAFKFHLNTLITAESCRDYDYIVDTDPEVTPNFDKLFFMGLDQLKTTQYAHFVTIADMQNNNDIDLVEKMIIICKNNNNDTNLPTSLNTFKKHITFLYLNYIQWRGNETDGTDVEKALSSNQGWGIFGRHQRSAIERLKAIYNRKCDYPEKSFDFVVAYITHKLDLIKQKEEIQRILKINKSNETDSRTTTSNHFEKRFTPTA